MKKPLLLISLVFLLAACGQESESTQSDTGPGDNSPVRIVASNYPLWFFASEISAGSVEVVLPEIKGDPVMWRPGPEGIELLQNADRILLNGAGYESWLNWISLPADRMVDTSSTFSDRLIPLEQETIHQHGPAGEHSHTGTAFTVWLDPELAIAQARHIEKILNELSPEYRDQHRKNMAGLRDRLKELDREQKLTFGQYLDKPLLFSHPVYQYLERRYQLDGYSLHWEPDQEPGQKTWIEFSNILREHPSSVMIWEDDPLPSTRRQLEDMGIVISTYHLASNNPSEGDYFDVMTLNLERLKSFGAQNNN